MKTYHLARPHTAKRKHFTLCCEKDVRNIPREDALLTAWEFMPEGGQACGGPSPEQVRVMNAMGQLSDRGYL